MAARIRNMTEGKPLPLILSFALPLMIGNIFQQLYTVVDTMVVGKALGVGALAALGASDWLNWLVMGLVQGMAQGFAILMAQEFGAKRYDMLRRVVGCSGVLAVVSSAVVLLAAQLIARPVLLLLQTPEAILGDALLYLRVMFFGIPIVMAYNLFACILRSLGDGKTPLYAMIVAAIVNILLDLLFVLVFHWGIAGAAAATLIAQLVSSFFCLWHLWKLDILKLSRSDFRVERTMARQLLLLGSPMAFQNAIICVGGMIVQFVVNGFGVIFIAGFTATNKLYGILEVAATSYGYAMITYVGQNLGAARLDRIRSGMRAALLIGFLTSLVITAFMLLFGRGILSLFISGTPEEAAETLDIAFRYLSIMSICLPILYVLHIVRSAIQGLGNTVLPMLSGVGEFVMRAATAIILSAIFGETGIFFAEVLAWIGADVVLIPGYIHTMRRLARHGIHLPESV